MTKSHKLWTVLLLKRQKLDEIRPRCAFEKADDECTLDEQAYRALYDVITIECHRLNEQIDADEILREIS